MTGEQIRATRKELGLTQRQLCAYFGITLNTLCFWETNRRRCAYPSMLRLAFIQLYDIIHGKDKVAQFIQKISGYKQVRHMGRPRKFYRDKAHMKIEKLLRQVAKEERDKNEKETESKPELHDTKPTAEEPN